jgi:hypothetical protein
VAQKPEVGAAMNEINYDKLAEWLPDGCTAETANDIEWDIAMSARAAHRREKRQRRAARERQERRAALADGSVWV